MTSNHDHPKVGFRDWSNMLARVDLPPTVKAVGLRLATFGDWENGTNIFPGVERLASDTSYSEKTVRRALEHLRDSGLIVRVFRGSTLGRRGLADEYHLANPPDLLDQVDLLPTGRAHRTR